MRMPVQIINAHQWFYSAGMPIIAHIQDWRHTLHMQVEQKKV